MAKTLICTLLMEKCGFESPVRRIELSWAAGKLPHFRSRLVRDISRWQENRISPIPRLNICHPPCKLTLSHRLICNYGDGMITSATDENNWHTWKRLWLGQKSSTLQDLSRLYLWHTWMRWLRGTSWYFIIHNHNHWLCAIFQKVNFDRAAGSTSCRKLLSSRSN